MSEHSLLGALRAAGKSVAPAKVGAPELLRALGEPERSLVIDPPDGRGWFGGQRIVCPEPVMTVAHESPAGAGDALDAVMHGREPLLAAALLRYDGAAEVRTYDSGFVWSPDGWRAWGPGAASVRVPSLGTTTPPCGPLLTAASSDMDEAAYTRAIDEVRERIRAGDVYVLNLTYLVSGRPTAPPLDAFEALAASANGPMAALWHDPERSLASVSPERFCAAELRADGSVRAWIEPIKGTRPRGTDAVHDLALARELAADEKERAEHVMIVDLERNDLGRVAVPGTVRVHPAFEVFSTPYCHQLVSRVEAVLGAWVTLGELTDAVFPCGSVTGAPKRAAMRIIGEMEPSRRGAYTGSLMVAVPGRMDSSVLIRTLEYDGPRHARWGTGCGVTVESDPRAEWAESRLKAVPVIGGA